jgi:hypothetical protein
MGLDPLCKRPAGVASGFCKHPSVTNPEIKVRSTEPISLAAPTLCNHAPTMQTAGPEAASAPSTKNMQATESNRVLEGLLQPRHAMGVLVHAPSQIWASVPWGEQATHWYTYLHSDTAGDSVRRATDDETRLADGNPQKTAVCVARPHRGSFVVKFEPSVHQLNRKHDCWGVFEGGAKDFYARVNAAPTSVFCAHEVISEDARMKPYLDCDMNKDDDGELFERIEPERDRYVTIMGDLFAAFIQHRHKPERLPVPRITTSHVQDKKISAHIVLDGVYYSSVWELRQSVEAFKAAMGTAVSSDDAYTAGVRNALHHHYFIDMLVYARTHTLRLPLASKPGEPLRKLVPLMPPGASTEPPDPVDYTATGFASDRTYVAIGMPFKPRLTHVTANTTACPEDLAKMVPWIEKYHPVGQLRNPNGCYKDRSGKTVYSFTRDARSRHLMCPIQAHHAVWKNRVPHRSENYQIVVYPNTRSCYYKCFRCAERKGGPFQNGEWELGCLDE